MPVSTLCPPRSSYRCISHSVVLVEPDPSILSPPSFSGGGADTHSLTAGPAPLHLHAQRVTSLAGI
ncbi:hypothetical protein PISMIDRAFT_685012 [Pisolithus microcarpus 441]|uniref:Uncharacterized protein n=1 Tax=Pisolithus microcarpus 441 TaxID=765257 RepID=A0A0C9XYS8_9AGAM|nr:hypothetical protein PISMIDRAFT_685012 [Pisolithus microcarpus 441]